MANAYKPQFKCPNASNDLFTLSTNTKGNKALTNPIGLITADEVVYAGGTRNAINGSYYLNNGTRYWTMSPSFFDSAQYMWFASEHSHLISSANYEFSGLIDVRPVINLKSDVEIISGDGRVGNEYVIKTN